MNKECPKPDWNNITRILSWNNFTFVEGNTLENRYLMFGLKLLTKGEKVSQNNFITGRSFLGYSLICNNQHMLLHVLYQTLVKISKCNAQNLKNYLYFLLIFQELALLHHKTRSATVLCKDEVSLLAVCREVGSVSSWVQKSLPKHNS